MNYTQVLTKAWSIIWKYKILWTFGILAGLGSATGSGAGESGSRYQFDHRSRSWSTGEVPPGMERFFDAVDANIGLFVALGIGLVCLGLILAVLFFVLSAVGRAGLVRGVLQVEQGAEKLSFGALFREGLRFFWRLFGLQILAFLATAILVPIVGVPLIILTCGLGVLAVIAFVIGVAVLVQISTIVIVADDMRLMDGIRRGWELMRLKLGEIIVMGLILNVGVQLLGGLIIAAPFTLFTVPFVLGLTWGNLAIFEGLMLGMLCCIPYVPVAILLTGILRAYIETGWTLTVQQLKPFLPALAPAELPVIESQPEADAPAPQTE
jgi:hypothetical protein